MAVVAVRSRDIDMRDAVRSCWIDMKDAVRSRDIDMRDTVRSCGIDMRDAVRSRDINMREMLVSVLIFFRISFKHLLRNFA